MSSKPGEKNIDFFTQDTEMPSVPPEKVTEWLNGVAQSEEGRIDNLNVVFCSDEFLHDMNVKHLNHDSLTDIITFPFSEFPDISGEMYISLNRVEENAETFGVSAEEELMRVIVHGLLHLMGYDDKAESDQEKMREREDHYLILWKEQYKN